MCVANQKGGVGKTTTAINLAVGLAKAGRKTLLLDLDPGCKATSRLGMKTAHRMTLMQPQLRQAAAEKVELLDFWPGSSCYEDAATLAELPDAQRAELAGQFRDAVSDRDFVLIDCPSSLGGTTEWALMASDEILLPMECEYFALDGLPAFIELVRRVMVRPQHELDFAGVLITKVNENLELAEEVKTDLREFFGDILFETLIPHDHKIAASAEKGCSVIDNAPRSRAARAYIELCKEVMNNE